MMKRMTVYFCCLLALSCLTSLPQKGRAAEIVVSFQLTEVLGHSWPSQLMHRSVQFPEQGRFFAGKCHLFVDGKRIPLQLDAIQCYPDGSIQQADVWFRTDMPAHGERKFDLRAGRSWRKDKTDLYLQRRGAFFELGNSRSAVRIPCSAKLDGSGPIGGIKLTNGKWIGRSVFSVQEKLSFPQTPGLIQNLPERTAGKLLSMKTEILARGPIFYRVRLTYLFAEDGRYSMTVTVRAGDPVLYFDEAYKNAGALKIDLSGYQPKKAWYKGFHDHRGKAVGLNYAEPKPFAMFTGWDGYFAGVAPAWIFQGAAEGQYLSLVSTNADWLPFPYNQALYLATTADGLRFTASLQDGKRHWGIRVGQEKEFPDLVNQFYLWWWQTLCLNMDKVLNWKLIWPGMAQLAFPHTFFSQSELPGIRRKLQANPVIRSFMKKYRDPATVLLYNGDEKMVATLKKELRLNYVSLLLENPAFFVSRSGDNMAVSDQLLTQYVGLELLLGSDQLSAPERRRILVTLAFVQYVTNDWSYWPRIDPFAPSREKFYPGYVCGTPNQKVCYLTARGIVAAMLRNHPEFKHWTNRALDDFYRIVGDSVAPSGAHLESPFYSSRDTMRYGPFWTAMTRAGVLENNPRAQAWSKRLKKCYAYMGQMLTIPDPRLNGRRAYFPIGRSSPGVVDPTIMISGTPFGEDDKAFLQNQRWCWEAQGKPSPNCMGAAGGRDMALTILAAVPVLSAKPATMSPLKSVRYPGMGLIGRSQVGSGYESSILFRQDRFCWNLYEGNNGAVYFWGKGAPLSIRFGGYWNHSPHLMALHFGNRLIFRNDEAAACIQPSGMVDWTNGIGEMIDYCLLGNLADYGVSLTKEKDWRRDVLFVKDYDREDPEFLLVRDDTSRKNIGSAVHWWIMSKDVQPDGYEKPGVVPGKGYSDADWIRNIGHNWKNAPKLTGQLHRFQTHFAADLDLFIATPAKPKIVTDAVGIGPRQPYCVNRNLQEVQELVRIEQGAGKFYLTLLSPTGKKESPRHYQTIAGGYGVKVDTHTQQNRLFLAPQKISYRDELVQFEGKAGFARVGAEKRIRLMVINGSVACRGFNLTSRNGKAGLLFDGKQVRVYTSNKADCTFSLPKTLCPLPISTIHCE